MKIGELAKVSGVPVQTIRYYEREGLLSEPARSEGNYRTYEASHLARLVFIRNCRALDMTHGEIRVLLRIKDLPDENCEQVNTLLDEHIRHVADRIAQLQMLQGHLAHLREQCTLAQQATQCGILRGLQSTESLETEHDKAKSLGHLHGVH